MWQLKTLCRLGLAVFLLGCSNSQAPTASDKSTGLHLPSVIGQLNAPALTLQELSSERLNKTVQVEGTVLQQAPLLEGSLYQIEDATGQAWILSPQAPPELGTAVQVRGVIQYEQILVEGIDIGEFYLQEKSRDLIEPMEVSD